MEKKKPIVVGIGELLWDMLPDGKRAGGAPVNFVYHATQQGADGYAISAVGKDILGKEIEHELAKSGIKSILAHVDYPTGVVEIELKDGIPSYNIVEGVAWDHIPLQESAIEIVKQADALCVGTLALRSPESYHTILKLLDEARPEALRLFDINIRQNYYSEDLIEQLLAKANIFKINDEEIDLLRPMLDLPADEDEAASFLMKKYALKYLILTAGAQYSKIYAKNEISFIPTPKVVVVDTVGAGDSFSSAFVTALMNGKTLKEAHQSAVQTAAFVCENAGAWPEYK